MPRSIPVIETPRLVLRAFAADDAEPLHRIYGEPDMLRYFPSPDPPPLESVRTSIGKMNDHWRQRGYGLWAMTLKPTGTLVGRCGMQWIADTEETEIDFILARDAWGRGLATEAAREGIRYGLERLRLDRIVGIVHPENLASRRVLEKIGLTSTGPARYFGMDCIRYAIERAPAD